MNDTNYYELGAYGRFAYLNRQASTSTFLLMECSHSRDVDSGFSPYLPLGSLVYKLRLRQKGREDFYVTYADDVRRDLGKNVYFDDDNVLRVGFRSEYVASGEGKPDRPCSGRRLFDDIESKSEALAREIEKVKEEEIESFKGLVATRDMVLENRFATLNFRDE